MVHQVWKTCIASAVPSLPLQGCSLEETQEHVHSLIDGLSGRQGHAVLKHLNPQPEQDSSKSSKM